MSLLCLSVPTVCGNQLLQQSAACHTKQKLQCAPHKLRHLIIVNASSTEIATSWKKFSFVCGLALCCCWQFIIILRQKLFVWVTFLREKKTLATLQASFLFFARKLPKQKVFALGWWKIISTMASHTHRKNNRMLQLLWKMQLQIQYTPVELSPYVYVLKNLLNSMLSRLQDFIRGRGITPTTCKRGVS